MLIRCTVVAAALATITLGAGCDLPANLLRLVTPLLL